MKNVSSGMAKAVLVLCCVAAFQACGGPKYSEKKGDYFGQTPPGIKAEKFSPDFVSLPGRGEYGVAFSSDGNECYISGYAGNSPFIYYTKRIKDRWTEQSEMSFSKDRKFDLSGLSADGGTIFLESDNDIWAAERKDGSWGEPARLPSPVNSNANDHSYTASSDGAIYVGSSRSGGSGNPFEIWRIPPSSDKAESLGPAVNSTERNLTPCVAKDGSYLIFAQSDTTYEHLRISFNKGDNQWTEPVDMNTAGALVNVSTYQNRPTLSPDGKYLFFNSHDSDNASISDIYWVSTDVIGLIRSEVLR